MKIDARKDTPSSKDGNVMEKGLFKKAIIIVAKEVTEASMSVLLIKASLMNISYMGALL